MHTQLTRLLTHLAAQQLLQQLLHALSVLLLLLPLVWSGGFGPGWEREDWGPGGWLPGAG